MAEPIVHEFTVDRWLGGTAAGHYGSPLYEDANGDRWGTVSLERLAGQPLGPGSTLRVTVEVVDAVPITDTAPNPWHEPARRVSYCPECVAQNPTAYKAR